MMPPRRVILLCGPPAAGKTTLARAQEGFIVYDIDDLQWAMSEARFRHAIRQLAFSPTARAVVIRSGASYAARADAARYMRATEIHVLATDAATCRARVIARNRPRPPIRQQLAAVSHWWDTYTATMPPTA